jgi:hypothetical protein
MKIERSVMVMPRRNAPTAKGTINFMFICGSCCGVGDEICLNGAVLEEVELVGLTTGTKDVGECVPVDKKDAVVEVKSLLFRAQYFMFLAETDMVN